MTIPQAVSIGTTADVIAKKITGSDEVSVPRTVIATGIGATTGIVASSTLVTVGIIATPISVPLAVAAGAVAFIASLF